MTNLNTSAFKVNLLSYNSSGKNLIYTGNTSYSVWDSTGYDVIYGGAGNDNYITWTYGLYDNLYSQNYTNNLSYSNFNGQNYPVSAVNGVGAIQITTSGMCTTEVYGEVTSVIPSQVAVINGDGSFTSVASGYTGSGLNYTAYTHQDISQVSSIDSQGYFMPPAIVLRAFNTNFLNSASGDTVTATLSLTGVTYVTGGTGTTTTYTDQMQITFDRSNSGNFSGVDGTPSNPSNQHYTKIFDYLPNNSIGIHRGLWTLKLSVSTSNVSNTANKYVRAYFINNS
jgi:hypothetical protein